MLAFNLSPFPTLHTSRLTLRQMLSTDAPEILALRSNHQAMRFIGKEKLTSIQEAHDFINLINHAWQYNHGLTWAVCLQQTNKLIGHLGFWRLIPEHHRAEIGYMLHPDFWGKNMMSEALEAAMTYGLQVLNLHSIEANADPENAGSIRLLEKHGFVREGYFRESYLVGNEFKDTASYSFLSSAAPLI